MLRILTFLLVVPLIGAVSCAPARLVGRSPVSVAKASSQVAKRETIDAIILDAARTFMNGTPHGGLALGIVRDGATCTYNFGELETGSQRLPSENTLYAIGSVTKTFTGALVAQAVTENRMNLNDDIRMYLDADYPNLEFRGEPIRLHHLLNHNSGLPFSLPENLQSSSESPKDQVSGRSGFYDALHHVKIQSAPGSKFQYSNAATQLLGYILEGVYRKPYEDILKTKITRPLGMRNTRITLTRSQRASLKGYDESDSIVSEDSGNLPAAGGIKSTVADLLKYLQWHLAETDESVKLTHQPMWKLDDKYSLGFNWQMFTLPGYRYIWQEGGLPGFSSYCLVCPELGLGMVVLINKLDRSSSDRLSAMVKQIVKGIDPRAADLP